jgi:hypothetical protein
VASAVRATDVEWAGDFSYDYLLTILTALQSRFNSRLLRDAPMALGAIQEPTVFIRHDIDLALRFALPVARMEADLDLRASYQVMTDCPLYDIESADSRNAIAELVALGHEVGLHVQLPDSLVDDDPRSELLAHHVRLEASLLESVSRIPVKSVSFHRPAQHMLPGPLLIAGRVNGYAAELMGWYLSDSAGRWREGAPVPMLLQPRKRMLQLLIHPFWWGPTHMPAADRLQDFFQAETAGMSADFAAEFDNRLSQTIRAVRRSGKARAADMETV